jgi:hypothetical protein
MRTTAALLALLASAPPCFAAVFEEVPATFLGAPVSLRAVSGDGLVMAGYTTSAPLRGLRWDTGLGWVSLGAPPDGNTYSLPEAISYDGSMIAARGNARYAYRWKLGAGWLLASVPPKAMSPDGTTIAGDARFGVAPVFGTYVGVWREGIGTEDNFFMGDEYFDFHVHALTADGNVVIGSDVNYLNFISAPVRLDVTGAWTEWEQASIPLDPIGWHSDCNSVQYWDLCSGEALAISADERTLVGWLNLEVMGEGDPPQEDPGPPHAVRWVDDGPPEFLERPPVAHSAARDVSGDGQIVVGQLDGRAFVWTPWSGIQDLKTHLEANGVDLTGWTLDNPIAISDSGTIIAGTGKRPGGANAFCA